MSFAEDVHAGLTARPRRLPPQCLYDALGSRLFEAICELPWYRITRAERALLARHGAEIGRLAEPAEIVELGSGDADKLAILLDAMKMKREPLRVHLIDISKDALEQARRTLDPFAGVWLTTSRAAYEEGIAALPLEDADAGRRLVLFLGSNIGNFDPPASVELLRLIRSRLRAGDGLLVGMDLVKPSAELEAAYDDPLGVTAAFNRNVLVRMNRELGAAIPLDAFVHRAVWNAAALRVEMHLVATREVRLHVPGARVDERLLPGDTIWTESSYKFDSGQFARDAAAAGFRPLETWEDPAARFALMLLAAA